MPVNGSRKGYEEDALVQTLSEDELDFYLHTYNSLVKRSPNLDEYIQSLLATTKSQEAKQQNQDKLANLTKFLEDSANDARTADTNCIKSNILSWMLEDPDGTPVLSRSDTSKSHRGFNHPATAELLCPVAYRKAFKRNKNKMIQKFRDGKSRVDISSAPYFVYDADLYNPDDWFQGLYRNHTLIRTGRAILLGESKALTGVANTSAAGKKCNANHNGILRITPAFIAYVACQVRFALSSVSSWSAQDDFFSYPDWHAQILKHFWSVFGRVSDEQSSDFQDSDLEPIDQQEEMAKTKERRSHEREARKAANAASNCIKAAEDAVTQAEFARTVEEASAAVEAQAMVQDALQEAKRMLATARIHLKQLATDSIRKHVGDAENAVEKIKSLSQTVKELVEKLIENDDPASKDTRYVLPPEHPLLSLIKRNFENDDLNRILGAAPCRPSR
ncbi:hypothetical protein D9758_018972 [Tetrapyrgos nigripes]|uniref:Uncharacterized protein n=1 Tax=Tetrapyrgos nigripes TaxID=182062 RepID=A0A8H5AUY7_9AGAR|nr:hypothetical protein D9758_018972 [Tetrapyrgos nigripes]